MYSLMDILYIYPFVYSISYPFVIFLVHTLCGFFFLYNTSRKVNHYIHSVIVLLSITFVLRAPVCGFRHQLFKRQRGVSLQGRIFNRELNQWVLRNVLISTLQLSLIHLKIPLIGPLPACREDSYICSLLTVSFPDFSLQSFEILTWHFVYELVLTWYKSNSSFITCDLILQELLPFVKKIVFQNFLCRLLRYWPGIWCVNWFWLNTDQGRVS